MKKAETHFYIFLFFFILTLFCMYEVVAGREIVKVRACVPHIFS